MLWTGDSPLFDFSALTLSNDDVGDVGDVASLAEAFANCDISFVERRADGNGAKDSATALAAELGGPSPQQSPNVCLLRHAHQIACRTNQLL